MALAGCQNKRSSSLMLSTSIRVSQHINRGEIIVRPVPAAAHLRQLSKPGQRSILSRSSVAR